nr:hypothetical protein CFP56_10222 [Quercus suber]
MCECLARKSQVHISCNQKMRTLPPIRLTIATVNTGCGLGMTSRGSMRSSSCQPRRDHRDYAERYTLHRVQRVDGEESALFSDRPQRPEQRRCHRQLLCSDR